ncbi:type II toxin-antitoxin system RelE family toxin [Paenibacillus agricola]|uniref:Type II toxin-antitoxin system RelE/ParE family toxin n=1 Tax=Paenibacillus agricola TaxID=2716264 RepID=A0ABX0JL18_9BACL|nr:type II toxin-antitoxin system RelE/ParE family toxin [Paenibacillus agricola]
MNYEIDLSSDSRKYLSKLDRPTRNRILDHLKILSENPRNPELDIKKLQGYLSLFRLRVGSYRILYTIEDNVLIIFVVTIGSRGDVYKF